MIVHVHIYINFNNILILLICRVNDAVKLKELITTARFARCRSRFIMPVILFGNKVHMSNLLFVYG